MKPGTYTNPSPGCVPSVGYRIRVNNLVLPDYGRITLKATDVTTAPLVYRGMIDIDNSIIGGFYLYCKTIGDYSTFKIWATRDLSSRLDIDADWIDVSSWYSSYGLTGADITATIPVSRPYGFRMMRVTCNVPAGATSHTIEISALKCQDAADPDSAGSVT